MASSHATPVLHSISVHPYASTRTNLGKKFIMTMRQKTLLHRKKVRNRGRKATPPS
jgi:hypothetical protein